MGWLKSMLAPRVLAFRLFFCARASVGPPLLPAADVSTALDRDLPAEVVAATKLHILDTIAAITSGSRLKAGDLAARYVASLGGNPQATVIGTRIVTSAVNAALANAMRPMPTRPTTPIRSARFISAAPQCRQRLPPRSSPGEPAATSCAPSRSPMTSA